MAASLRRQTLYAPRYARDIPEIYPTTVATRIPAHAPPGVHLRVISACISGDLGEEIMAIMTSNFWTTMAAGRLAWVRAEKSPRWRRDVPEIMKAHATVRSSSFRG